MGDKRRLVLAGTSVLMLFILAAPAQAALFLVFDTTAFQPDNYSTPNTGGLGSPGKLVRAHTGGRGAVRPNQVMPAFLTSDGYPATVESSSELGEVNGLTPIGDLRSDKQGNGVLEFETPQLSPGDYEIVVYCQSCAAFSSGSNVVSVAPFRITGNADSTDGSRSLIPIGAVLVGFLVALIVLRKYLVRS
jgi:hypothetical protein